MTKDAYVVVQDPAPVAAFSGSPLSGVAPLPVTLTDLSSGPLTSWAWTLGDGSTSTDQHPTHTYTKAGTYAVQLTVTGPGGSKTVTKDAYVVVQDPAPVAAFSGSPLSGVAPLPVTLTDLSSGPLTSWAWTLGDGSTSTDQHPTHTYTQAGTYAVQLTVTGPGGSKTVTKDAYVVVQDPAPVAAFSGSPLSGVAPLAVTLTDLSSGPLTSWAWTLGDGSTSTDQHPTHTYTQAGTYAVQLTVQGPGGSKTVTKDAYVVVKAPAPVAAFSGSPLSGVAPLAVTLTDLSSGPLTSWAWTLGDGSTSTDQHPTHTYTQAGTYAVQLTVQGPGGTNTLLRDQLVIVREPAPIADFHGAPMKGAGPLPVTFSDSSTGTISTWLWNFGDGETSNKQHPKHTYKSSGQYSVSLTISGPGGTNSLTRNQLISVESPKSESAVNQNNAPESVREAEGSAKKSAHDEAAEGSNTNSSTNSKDSKEDSPQPVSPSEIELVETDSKKNTDATSGKEPGTTKSITDPNDFPGQKKSKIQTSSKSDPIVSPQEVKQPVSPNGTGFVKSDSSSTQQNSPTQLNQSIPIQQFSIRANGLGIRSPAAVNPIANKANAATNQPVQTPVGKKGEGRQNPQANQSQNHEFSDASHPEDSTDPVKLAFEDSELSKTGEKGGASPTSTSGAETAKASFTVEPMTGSDPLAVSFSDNSTGDITSWLWDFGDGTTSTSPNPSHQFKTPGEYPITLTVTDANGESISTRKGTLRVGNQNQGAQKNVNDPLGKKIDSMEKPSSQEKLSAPDRTTISKASFPTKFSENNIQKP